MKLDINRAWTDALTLIQSNIGVVAIVGGVFFFLPYFAMMLLMPDMAQSMTFEPNEDPSVAMEQITALYADIWLPMLLVFIAQAVGTLSLLALLRDQNRPTVGQALGIGGVGLLTYIAATILLYLAFVVVVGIVMGIAIASGITALAVVLGILAFIGFVYVAIKLSLMAPVIAIDKVYNPLTAITRSWRLTKGNSLRLLAFYVLLTIALAVVSMVLGLIVMLVFGLMGEEVALIGSGFVNSALNAVYVVLFLGILAAIHRQLAGPDAETVSETFE
ncbi:glycerophosphoryl diester phosphodiesterase membrane domain-containing protein [Alteriqipengyuania sp. 357]